jgi:Fe(3+) dicitrate transport protein
MAIIKAEIAQDSPDNALDVRANRRNYYGQGVELILGIDAGPERARHDIEIGIRYHEDEEDRFQNDDGYRMTAGGEMVLTGPEPPGTQSNRVSSAEALSVYVQDTIDIGRWAVVPGLRYEWIDLHRVDFANPERTEINGSRSNSVNEAIPGIGVEYEINPSSRAFLGVHRGFAPPSPSNEFAIAEDAVNYELGYRFAARRLHATAIGFLNDYSSLLGECTAATGCVGGEIGDQFNAGASRTWGLELTTGYEFQSAGNVRWPVSLVYTYTGTEFLTAFESDYEPWGRVEAGDEFPYVPTHQATLSAGVVHPRVSAYAGLVYFDRVRTVAGQGPIPQDESTDAAALLELTVNYYVKPELRLFFQGRNLTDAEYVASRRPAGARPGLHRTILLGVAFEF